MSGGVRPVAGFQKKKTERKKKRACSRPPVLLRGGGRGRACCPPTGPRHGRVRIGGRGSARRGTGTLLWTGAPSRSPRGCRRATPSPRERTPRTAVGSGRQQRREWRRLATRARDPPRPPRAQPTPPLPTARVRPRTGVGRRLPRTRPRVFFFLCFFFFVPFPSSPTLPLCSFFFVSNTPPRGSTPPSPPTLKLFLPSLFPFLPLYFSFLLLSWPGRAQHGRQRLEHLDL